MYDCVLSETLSNISAEDDRILIGVNRYPRTYEGPTAHSNKDFYLINMIGYIYKTVNLINGKIYIGQHQAKEFDKKYFGSGKLITRAVKKYGKDNFYVYLIHKCYKTSSLSREEKKYIKLYKSTDRNIGYNIAKGDLFHSKGWHHTEKTRKKLRIARSKQLSSGMKGKKMSEEARQKMRESAKHKPKMTNETKQKISKAHIGLGHTEETKEKLRQINLGKKYSLKTRIKKSESAKRIIHTPEWNKKVGLSNIGRITSMETKNKISRKLKGRIPWNKGIPQSEEAKKKNSESNKNRWIKNG